MSTLTFSGNVTNTTTPSVVTTTTVASSGSSENGAILALLVIILLVLLAMPVVMYILVRKFCWIKVHNSGTGEWQTRPIPVTKDRDKKTQTDVLGIELEEFYKRRQPTDMSKYVGKELPETAEQIRWNRLDPKSWNDPWTTKHAGKETNYVKRVF